MKPSFLLVAHLVVVAVFHASAQGIIYSQPTTPINYSAGILDNTADIYINGIAAFAIISTSSYTADIAPLGDNSIIAVPAPPPNLGYFVGNVPYGTVIDSTTPMPPDSIWYNNQSDQFGSAIIGAQAGMTGPPLGYFTDTASAYVGFDLVQGGQDYYGWIQLSNPYPFVAGNVVDWAYESTPNTPIAAGAVPEPGTAGLLALGLVASISTARKRLLGLTGGALLALAVLPAAAETPSEKADALLEGLIKTNDPGLAVLVAQDGKILFEKGCGLADREYDVPVSPQTTFRIGSITKTFTAAAILKLQEEGRLSVDDKLSKYIPDFPRGDEVTLRHLLTHTSGIRDFTDKPDFDRRVTSATTTAAVIEEMKKDPYDFDPGGKWSYDNSGYILLGYIVEKVSGQTYGDFLRANFFQPLGMTNTGVCRAELGLPHEALGYSLGPNGFARAPNWDMSWLGGAGALYSTVEDLNRWIEGLHQGRVLDATSLKAALTPTKTKENEGEEGGIGYGFGVNFGRYRRLGEIWHTGGVDGFVSCLLRVPDKKFTVVTLANARPGRRDADPVRLADRLVDVYLAPQPVVNTNVSPASYDALTGRYEFLGTILTISRRGAHLFVERADHPEAELFPESDTEFFAKVDDLQFTFGKDRNGQAVKLIDHEDCEGCRGQGDPGHPSSMGPDR